MIVGATIEGIIIDDTTDDGVSASRFVPNLKDDEITIRERSIYSKNDVLVINSKPLLAHPEFSTEFARELLTSISLAQDYISAKDPNCSIRNIAEKIFRSTELTDRYIRIGLSTQYCLHRCTTLGLHFSEAFIDTNTLADILDINLKPFYDKERDGFRKAHFGCFGRNIIKRNYRYFGRDLNGFVYISLSSEVISKDIFSFTKAIKKSIDEYHNG